LPLRPRRDLRRVAGRFDDLLRDAPVAGRDDYLEVTLEDRGPILDAMGRLREVYPNVLHVARAAGPEPGEGLPGAGNSFRGMDDAALFAAFFRQVTAEELAPEETAAVTEVIAAEQARQREA
jgi:exonuclease SbcD